MDTGSDDRHFQTQWCRVSSRLKAEIGETAFENWVKPIQACDVNNTEVRLAVPSRFMRDWVVANYLDRLKELWAGENENVRSVEVLIQPTMKTHTEEPRRPGASTQADVVSPGAVSNNGANSGTKSGWESGGQIAAPLDKRFRFDQFVVGKPNEFAYAAARRVAEAQSVSFNPLFFVFFHKIWNNLTRERFICHSSITRIIIIHIFCVRIMLYYLVQRMTDNFNECYALI